MNRHPLSMQIEFRLSEPGEKYESKKVAGFEIVTDVPDDSMKIELLAEQMFKQALHAQMAAHYLAPSAMPTLHDLVAGGS